MLLKTDYYEQDPPGYNGPTGHGQINKRNSVNNV